MNITKEEKTKILDVKKFIDIENVNELGGLLEKLPESPRYIIVSGLQVTQFLTSSPFPPEDVKGLTLEELVQNGPASFVLIDGVTNEHVTDLNQVLSSLVEGSDELIDHPGKIQKEPVQEEDFPRYSSIEAERLLVESSKSFQALANYEDIKDKKIAEDWQENTSVETVPSAPFIEALSYKELFNIPPTNLLKKRIMTDKKIYCLISLLQSQSVEDNNDKPRTGILPKSFANLLIRIIKKLS